MYWRDSEFLPPRTVTASHRAALCCASLMFYTLVWWDSDGIEEHVKKLPPMYCAIRDMTSMLLARAGGNEHVEA